MNDPINQTKLFGLNNYFNELKYLFDNNKLPNNILLSGQKDQVNLHYHYI